MKPRAEEGESMTDCEPWKGEQRHYQDQAQRVLSASGRYFQPWVWVIPNCETPDCLYVPHLDTHEPRAIQYPAGRCVYCGEDADTRDHLLPRGWTGDTKRYRTATVPACMECNAIINDFGGFAIGERRDEARKGLRRKYKKLIAAKRLETMNFSSMGPSLGPYMRQQLALRQSILARLSWPEDPTYDERAFQQSGIADPYALGLL